MKTQVKTPEELSLMVDGGKKLKEILLDLLDFSRVGVSLLDIENRAQNLIKASGGTPSFQTVEDYKYATCLCINDVVVHGIPTKYKIVENDVLTIDIGMIYGGLHTDTAWTKLVSSVNPDDKSPNVKFLQIGEQALIQAISAAKAGNRIGHISQIIQSIIEGAGYSVVKSLVGHGVGRELHEMPQIPGFLRGPIESTPLLVDGMTIAIEIIYAMGKGDIIYANDDGWSIATRDGSLSACFERTVAITGNDAVILT